MKRILLSVAVAATTYPVYAQEPGWDFVKVCQKEVEYWWDDGHRSIYHRPEWSVQMYGHGENLVFSVNDRGNTIRDSSLKSRYVRCYMEAGMKRPELDKFPKETSTDFAPPG